MSMRLMTPGPASSLPSVLSVMSNPLIHHRTEEFQSLYQDCVQGLKRVFQTTEGEVAIVSGSGTTGLEAGIINVFQENDTVLVIDCGYFGERLANIARIHKLNVIHYKSDWKKTYEFEAVKNIIHHHVDLKGILMVYSETSTGALHDVKTIGEYIKDKEILLFVDCISGLVMNPFVFDDWHVDVAVAASQKGFFLSPGLAFVCLSKKALTRARTLNIRTYYLNLLVIIDKYHDNQKISATPNFSLLMGLQEALRLLESQPVQEWNSYYAKLHEQLAQGLEAMGLLPFTDEKTSNSLCVCRVPQSDAFAIRNSLYQDSDIVIEVGLGDMAQSTLRIGCMNGVTVFDVLDVLRGLKKIITEA